MKTRTIVENIGVLQNMNATDSIEDWKLVIQIVDLVDEFDAILKRYNKAYNAIQFKYGKRAEKAARDMTIDEQEGREIEIEELLNSDVKLSCSLPIISEDIAKKLYEDKEINFKIQDIKQLKSLGMYNAAKS